MAVRYHHEKWDGSGYPEQLTAEEIPWIARIINIADSMDAMLMNRAYKESYPVDRMLDELLRCAGTQFDPDMAGVAIAWCDRNLDRLFIPNEAMELLV